MTEDDGPSAGRVAVIGLGNRYRRDDGVGVAAAIAMDDLAWPNVVVTTGIAEPMGVLEAWTGAALAVIIDAAIVTPATPGRIHRYQLDEVPTQAEGLSSHSIDLGRTHALARALGRTPDEAMVFAVEAADTGSGDGLTPRVARAVPVVVGMVAAEINRFRSGKRSQHAGSR
ncbi:hydrogenase maturation protease [Mycobacterium nebraskense]|uniref:Peptidase M52 n=1 Tax=Mycobacterium nebraskense TaxID=244292 RepID=A0A0F5NCG6_9MYCO|nr:hydrogenase maturation protease [Mycobacterium nebraskense]KKC04721.1 peptidase M52 [Mycobacterium nebraskense]KLO39661.1 peptidase M52 [Mycobacterium nebraskense]MBI2695395.1 hydrogenase maturation protease [Mycobacterium nebraskense]MCV7121375.1 hydrogenase maturation protease [Mycobacterium nebraskense]ORW30286.1 peptidase M52 [Mycobacterium nebraskense]